MNRLAIMAAAMLGNNPLARHLMPSSVRGFKEKQPNAELQAKAEAKRARKNAKRAKDHHHE